MKVTELNNQFMAAYRKKDSDEIDRLAAKERTHLKASSVFADEEHENFHFGLLYNIRLGDDKDDTPLQSMMNVPVSLKPALLEYMAIKN